MEDIEKAENINIVKKVCKDYGYTLDELSFTIGIPVLDLETCIHLNIIPLHIKKSIELLIKSNEYEKDLIHWHSIKMRIHTKDEVPIFKERMIYWASIGKNIGYEQNGKGEYCMRPLLIFRKFSKNSFLGIPLTTNKKDDNFHFSFSFMDGILSSASLSQIRLFDAKRLHRKIGKISSDDFKKIEERLKGILFPLEKIKR